jgi:outer membrane protein assembly factor BamA
MQPAAFSRGRYSQALLTADAASLAGIYQANGFLQVRVSSRSSIPTGKDENLVRFHIQEERRRV